MARFRFVKYDHRAHLDYLFQHMSDPEEQKMFLSHHVSNSLRDFDNWIQDRLRFFYNEFYMVESGADHTILGMVYSYEHRLEDGHAKVAVYISPEYRKNGIGAFAAVQFIHQLFSFYPFRRVYCDVYSYNTESLNSLQACGFEQTGCLREYRYLNGCYYDLLLLTITREAFYQSCSSLMREGKDGSS